jgi:hypothetical protein
MYLLPCLELVYATQEHRVPCALVDNQVDNKWDIVWAARQKVEDVSNRCPGGSRVEVLLSWRSSGADDTQPQRFCGLSQTEKCRRRRGKARCAICVIVGKRLAAERSKLPKCRVLGGSGMHVMTW